MERIKEWNKLGTGANTFLSDELYDYVTEYVEEEVTEMTENIKNNMENMDDSEIRYYIDNIYDKLVERIDEVVIDEDNTYEMNKNMHLSERAEIVHYINYGIDFKEKFEDSLEDNGILDMFLSVVKYNE